MRKVFHFVLVAGLLLLLHGSLLEAAGTQQATVGDLVKVIAETKRMRVQDVEQFLAARAGSLNMRARLTERLAADIFSAGGLKVKASTDRAITASQLERLRELASFASFQAPVTETSPDGGISASGEGDNEVRNRGIKTRAGGRSPNSNANINAFESLRDDPRE